MGKKKAKKSSFFKKVIIAFLVIILSIGGISVWEFYKLTFKNNVHIDEGGSPYIYIRTGSTFDDVKQALYDQDIIIDQVTFEWFAELRGYKHNIKPGRYKIQGKMGNKELLDMLRAGIQEPLNIVLNQIRTRENLASQVGKQLEADSTELLRLLNSNSFMHDYGLNAENAMTLFLPNTYEFYWNTNAREFIDRMNKEHERFWTEERKAKAKATNLTPSEITILASIVEKETQNRSEQSTVAGVYLNRLNKGMLLQADPTLVFAVGDFTIKRVLNKHKAVESPYNTYKYKGLPPGPICLPDIKTIDNTLNHKKHDYLYFCANPDMSGTHIFAKTYQQHLVNARRFQSELNKRKIYR